MGTERERVEVFATSLTEWANDLFEKMNQDPTAVFLFDQAAAEVRDRPAPILPCSASANSRAVPKRSAGSFSSAWSSAAST